jgi:Raf kinase inhibitor-like YbhB/YbcL family protein
MTPRALAIVAAGALAALLLTSCGGGGDGENATLALPEAAGEMVVQSSAFADGAVIPERYTCDGDGTSPPLSWSRVPHRAHSLALVVDDPKAGHFVHWTVLDIPPTVTAVKEGEAPKGTETDNSLGEEGWTGPCPPEGDGEHEYLFSVYAVDAPLGLKDDASHDEIRRALEQHAIARGVLTGRFGRG